MSETEQRNKILTELFESKKLHHQVLKICSKNNIAPDTFISEDIVSETFYYLSKATPTKIISIYNQSPVNLLGYAVCIAIRKGVLKDPKNPDYHKHSVSRNILFASNLNKYETIADGDEIDEDDHSNFKHVLSVPIEGENIERLWALIKDNLTKSDNLFLDILLHQRKKRGRYKNHVKVRREKLFDKIKMIVIDNKIKI